MRNLTKLFAILSMTTLGVVFFSPMHRSINPPAAIAEAEGTTGEHKLLVVTVMNGVYSDADIQTIKKSFMDMSKTWEEWSYGRFKIVQVDTAFVPVGVVQMSNTSGYAAYLKSKGINTSQYRLIYINDGSTAHGEVGGTYFYGGGFYHEGGHVLGLWHASKLHSTNNTSVTEYGDLYDVMGQSVKGYSYNAPHKEYLKWLTPTEVKEATENGTFTILPLESQTPGLKAVKIRRTPLRGDYLFIEYRAGTNGALVHVTEFDGQFTNWIPDGTNHFFKAGLTFHDPARNVDVKVASVNSAGLTLSVTFGPKDTTPPAAPVLTFEKNAAGDVTLRSTVSNVPEIFSYDIYQPSKSTPFYKVDHYYLYGNPAKRITSTVFGSSQLAGATSFYVKITDYAGNSSISNVVNFGGSGANQAPIVNAGTDQTIILPNTLTLDGSATDDGKPNPPAQLTITGWSKFSGPGTVTFNNAATLKPVASFSQAGTYVLRLTVTDGSLTSTDDVTVVVNATTSNQAPVVNAAPDQTIKVSESANLTAVVTDDGLPSNSITNLGWSRFSGLGSVTFADSKALVTTATFSAVGSYVLRFTASDGSLQGYGDLDVTVEAPADNDPPVVDAGPDLTVSTNALIELDGSVIDEEAGPLGSNPPGAYVKWSILSTSIKGARVQFGNENAAVTSVVFYHPATYVLRLTASDGLVTSQDDMTVIVNTTPSAPPLTTLVISDVPGSGFRLGSSTREVLLAQDFIATHSSITSMAIGLTRNGVPNYPIKVAVRSSLNGPDLATAIIGPFGSNQLSNKLKVPDWKSVNFTSPVPVTPGEKYFVVLTVDKMDKKNFYRWSASNKDYYPSGIFYTSSKPFTRNDALLKIYFQSAQ